MSFIRWKAVGPLTVIILLISLFIIFFLDACVKWAIIKGGESVFGAKVEIDFASLRLSKSALLLNGVKVADKSAPMTNLFEFSKASFDFEALPLLEKKVIIDDASLADLRFGTPRKTSGALPFVEKKPGFVGKATDRLWSQVETFSIGKLDAAKQYTDPKTIVNPQALESVKAAENAKTTLSQIPSTIQNDFKSLDADKRAADLRSRVESLSKQGSGLQGALKTAEEVKNVQKDLQSFKADIEKTKQDVTQRIQQARDSVENVKKARDQDWNKLKSLVSLPSLDKESLARTIFGPSVVNQIERVLGYVYTARQYMPAKAAAPPPPPRGKGRVIEFPRENVLPRFLLKKALLSGEVGQDNPLSFQGTLADLTSNPPLWGRPAVAGIKGAQAGRALNAALTLDYTKETPHEEFKGQYSGFALGSKTVGQPDSFALAISQGLGTVNAGVSITGDALQGNVQFQGQQLHVQPSVTIPSNSPIATRVSQNLTTSLSKVNQLSVGVGLGGTLSSPTMNINSNIGDIVSGALKNALGAEMAEQEKALRAELNKHTDAALKQLEGQLSQLQSQFLPQLSSQNKVVEDLLGQLKGKATQSLPIPGGDKPLKDLKNIFGR